MNTEAIRELFRYYKWANNRMWEGVMSLTEEQLTQEHDYSVGSVHNQVFHCFHIDWEALFYFKGERPPEPHIKQEDYPTREKIRQEWDAVLDSYIALLEKFDDKKLLEGSQVKGADGELRDICFWEHFYAMINHGMNHRTQVMALLHHLGVTQEIEQGYYFYMRDR